MMQAPRSLFHQLEFREIWREGEKPDMEASSCNDTPYESEITTAP
jgi:hypothetical protein